MVSSAIDIRTCLADELYKLYSVREKISVSSIFDINALFRAFEMIFEKTSIAMVSDQLFIGCVEEDRQSGPCRTAN
jgi:hypothetical protein